jgi:hypothetical protein
MVKEWLLLSLKKLEIKFNSHLEHTVKHQYIIYPHLQQPMPWLQKFKDNVRDRW